MEQVNQFLDNLKASVMQKMLKYTDSEYYLLKFKPNLDAEESKFIKVYENIYLMQGISLIALIPATFYLFRGRSYKKNLDLFKPGYTKQQSDKIMKKSILYLSFGTVLAVNSQIYEYMNDFSRLHKQISNRQRLSMQKKQLIPIQ